MSLSSLVRLLVRYYRGPAAADPDPGEWPPGLAAEVLLAVRQARRDPAGARARALALADPRACPCPDCRLRRRKLTFALWYGARATEARDQYDAGGMA